MAQVYLPENLKDIEDRLHNVEEVLEPFKESGSVEGKIKSLEDEWKKVPPGLITNWTEVETQMKVWHTEEKERKGAVKAIWKKLSEVQEDEKMKSLEAELKDIKATTQLTIKDLYEKMQYMEENAANRTNERSDKDEKFDWERRMERADFNKPLVLTDGDKGFVNYAAGIKRWGHKIHDEFTKILEIVESEKENRLWTAEDFDECGGMTEEEMNRISKALYDIFEETIESGSTPWSYVSDKNNRDGFRAWRK